MVFLLVICIYILCLVNFKFANLCLGKHTGDTVINYQFVDEDDLGVERDLLVRCINRFSSRSPSPAKKGSDQVGRSARSDSFGRVSTLENKVQKIEKQKDKKSME